MSAEIADNIVAFPTPVRKPSKTEQIYDMLRRGPCEVGNLAYVFDCSQAAIRAIVQDLRMKGVFVLSARGRGKQYYHITGSARTYSKFLRDHGHRR
ncbi:hypothetical protein NKH41_09600 [Mesorhizobium sp. M1169]|uniref:hypothetical protein n=1 Tax=Mesorhizobium sp. M1169 TaxID=2957066 RepID=UPI0033393959